MASIEISEQRGVRYLHFGTERIQGAMRIARPWALELEYTRQMMMPLLLHARSGWPASVLQIGLGSASVTKFVYRCRPKARITVVEIVPGVISAARQFFRLPEPNARLRLVVGDGHEFLASTERQFDFILVDGFDGAGRAGVLDTLPFYLNCHAHLSGSGTMAVNLLGRRRGAAASEVRIRRAFGGRVLLLPPCEAGNTVALAAAGEAMGLSFAELRARALAFKAQWRLDLVQTVDLLAADRVGKDGLLAL